MLDQADKLRKLTENKETIEHTTKPTVITVTSGKGGVGKSNFVVNLAISLQKSGKKVLIFDADVGMGNDDVLMGFYPKNNILDVLYDNIKISEVVVEGPFGVKLLPGGTGSGKLENVTDAQRENFLQQLTQLNDLDYIIMDTGAGINRDVLGYIACCDELIILTTPEPTSLTDAYSLIKVVNYFNIKTSAKVVINRILNNEDGKLAFEKFNNTVKSFLNMDMEYLGCISEDNKIAQSVRKQQPFLLCYPNCSASKDINLIAATIVGDKEIKTSFGAQVLFQKLFNIFS